MKKNILLTALLAISIPTTAFAAQLWYKPKPDITWQWQLNGEINTSYPAQLYDVDLEETPQNIIDELHEKGRNVVCYFSAGSVENTRDDSVEFAKEVIGNPLEGWPDEKWLDISRYKKFSHVMTKRLDRAKEKKCDAVEPDNINAYQENTGFKITAYHQLKYNRWLAREAHKRGLGIALKNDGAQAKALAGVFDFAISEQCFEFGECELFKPFIKRGKAVLGVEYNLNTDEFCSQAKKLNYSWLKLNLDLDGTIRQACE